MPRKGRDGKGRFAKGNPGGPGNPHAIAVAKLREALLKAVTPDAIQRIITKLIAQAEAGDTASAKILLDRVLGPPVAIDLIERLEALEAKIANGSSKQA